MLATLIPALRQCGGQRGIAALCLDGEAVALAVEVVWGCGTSGKRTQMRQMRAEQRRCLEIGGCAAEPAAGAARPFPSATLLVLNPLYTPPRLV